MDLEAPHLEGPCYPHLSEVHLVWDHQICVVVDTMVLVALQGLLDQELPLVPWVRPCQGDPLVRQLPMELVVALLQTEHQPKEAPISLRLLDHWKGKYGQGKLLRREVNVFVTWGVATSRSVPPSSFHTLCPTETM